MARTLVTRLNNINLDENDDPIILQGGEVSLKNPAMIGYITQNHIVPITQTEEIDGKIVTQQGLISRAEVYWEHQRSPAPALEDPADLFWLSFSDSEESDDESNQVDSDNEESYEDDDSQAHEFVS